jgi:hypothetical protein
MTDTLTAEQAVQQQLDAYNAHDLDRFIAVYDENVRIYRPPASEPSMVGRAALGQFHATQRFNLPALRADLVRRIVAGSKVVDHERVFGLGEQPFEVAVVYEVRAGRITAVWYFPAA